MSRYGTVTGGAANARSITVQASEPDTLLRLITAAVSGLLNSGIFPSPVITAVNLTGAGDGFMFFLQVEIADTSNVDGGVLTSGAQFFLASTADALTAAQNAGKSTDTLLDVQIAGAAKGQRVMGLALFGQQLSPPTPLVTQSRIVYAPALLNPTPPVYNDWNQIEAIVNARQGAVRLLIDQSGGVGFADIPATANLDGRGRLEIIGAGPRGEPQMKMADGAQIKNVREWRTIVVRAAPTIRSPIVYDLNGLDVECFDATFLFPAGGAPTLPIIDVIPGNILFPGYLGLFMLSSSELKNNNAPGVPVLHIGDGITLLLSIGTLFFGSTFDHTISGTAAATLNVQTDASLPTNIVLAPEFVGSLSRTQIDQAPGMGYTPAVLANWTGVSPETVQIALDRIAAAIGPIAP